jgi:trimethylamine--corrinoid protein Co-methyltransferase
VRTRVEWTSREERERIVDAALELLERVGMRFGPSDALEALGEAGARVDRAAGEAFIPADLVRDSLGRCPRRVVLGGMTSEDDCVLDDGVMHFTNSGSPTETLDMDSGERRLGTAADLRLGTMVLDAMPSVDIVWELCGASDIPERRRLFEELAIILQHTRKHVQHEIETRSQVPALMAMSEVAGGDLRTRPRVSLVCCTASPLLAHGELLDASTDMAALGMPVVVYPMPIAGATAPLTVAGTVTMNIAEFLGAATAIQLRAPGAPLIMGAGTALLDMHQTTYSFGALETGLMAATCVEVAHHLGVPCLAPALGTDAKYPGVQAAYEKALKGLTVASSTPDLMTGGIGQLQGAGLMSIPQIVIDDEIAQMITRSLQGVEVSPETIQLEMMERIGHSGEYLKEKDTRRRLRAGELFLPTIADRQSWQHWKDGGVDEVERAKACVRQIAADAEECGPLLSESQLRDLADCVDAGSVAGS